MSDSVKKSSGIANLSKVLGRAAIVWGAVLVFWFLPTTAKAQEGDYCYWNPLGDRVCWPFANCVSKRVSAQLGYLTCCVEQGSPGYYVCYDQPTQVGTFGCCLSSA
jgi:hypothetical protein